MGFRRDERQTGKTDPMSAVLVLPFRLPERKPPGRAEGFLGESGVPRRFERSETFGGAESTGRRRRLRLERLCFICRHVDCEHRERETEAAEFYAEAMRDL